MLDIIHLVITLFYSFIFYFSIISSCCQPKKCSNSSNFSSESPKISQEPEVGQVPEKSKQLCDGGGGGKSIYTTSISKEKSDKKLENKKKSREKSVSKREKEDLSRPGYSKSLIAIQEAALSQIFMNGSTSDRKPDRTLQKNVTSEKSEFELNKTQEPEE